MGKLDMQETVSLLNSLADTNVYEAVEHSERGLPEKKLRIWSAKEMQDSIGVVGKDYAAKKLQGRIKEVKEALEKAEKRLSETE